MRHRIESKITRIRYYLKLLEGCKEGCEERFVLDPMFEGALLHYLYLASDGCVSIAEMVLKYLDKGSAQSYYEAYRYVG